MNVLKLQKKYPVLEQSDLFNIIEDFRAIDLEDKGWVERRMLSTVSANRDNTPMTKQEKH